jgi:hypothetical protein
MQELLVGIIVFAVLAWLGIRFYRSFRSNSCGCAGGCSACGKTDCTPPEPPSASPDS